MKPLESSIFHETVDFLVNTQYWPKEKLYDLQVKKLQSLVKYVSENTPFYRKFLNKEGLRWEDFKKVEDVKKFPLLTKKFLQDNYDEFLPLGVDKSRLSYRTTGGSTGTPLTVYGDLDFFAKYKANTEYYMRVFGLDIFNYRSIRLYGDKIDEELLKKGVYWHTVENRKLIMSCYHITKRTAKKYVDKINEFKPVYMHTKPSSVLPLANYILNEKLAINAPVKYIFCDGEYITSGQRLKIQAAFKARVINIYGHTEGCAAAHPCELSDNLHFIPQAGIVELLDADGNEVKHEGAKGELVVTGFSNFIFPLIRYKTQDIGILGGQNCACGRNYKILSSIEGRVQDYVIDREDNLVPLAPAVFNYDDMDWKGVKEFKVLQKEKGELIFKILLESKLEARLDEIEQVFKKKISAIFGFTFDIIIEFVDELPKSKIGKYRYLEQKLELAWSQKL